MNTSTLLVRLIALGVLIASAGELHAGPKIGVLLKAGSGFWGLAERGAVAAGETLGAEILVRSPQDGSEAADQIQLLNTMIGEGCQAVVLAPADRDTLVAPVAAATARGVKVVILDTRLARDAGSTFVGTDQTEAGRAAGRALAGLLDDGDHVGLFRHSQGGGATDQREAGALEALRAERPGLVVLAGVYASTQRGMETSRATFLLNQDPAIKGVIASGTPGTMAMLHVLTERGLAGKIHLVGFGYNLNRTVAAAIEKGAMDAWIAQLPEELGRVGVQTAAALLRGETVPSTVATRFEVVTKDNQRDPAITALLVD